MSRPSFIEWATSAGGMYLHDKKKPTLALFIPEHIEILNHIFPGGDEPLPYNRICWSIPKKSGKSELAAAVHIWFALFVDVPGEQYCLANDYEGSKSRIWKSIVGSLEKNPLIKRDEWRVVGSEIHFNNGSTIKAIAADYRGEAGSNHSLATVDEPWGIIHERGERLMTEFSPVPTRPNSTIFYTGYQGFFGVSKFWHELLDAGMGTPVPELAHIDNGDGQPACWQNGKIFVYWDHKARMPWHTTDYMRGQRLAAGGAENEYLRVWENRRVQNVEAFVTEGQWDGLRDTALQALHPDDKREIIIGIDAATKADCAAVVAVHWNEERKRIEALFSSVWRPQPGRPLQLLETVGPEILRLHREYRVVAATFDPFQMAAIAELCRREGVNMIEFPQTTRRVQADTHLRELVWGNNFAHTGDPMLRTHALNAVATAQGDRGVRLNKASTSQKMDAMVALSMAALVAVEKRGHVAQAEAVLNPFY